MGLLEIFLWVMTQGSLMRALEKVCRTGNIKSSFFFTLQYKVSVVVIWHYANKTELNGKELN